MTRIIKLSLVLLFVGMHVVFAAEESLIVPMTNTERDQQRKKDFRLSTFMALPDELQLVVLEYLQPDAEQFEKNLKNFKTDRLKEALIGEFFYNHAQKYNEFLQEKNGDTKFVIIQEPSQLCAIHIHNINYHNVIFVAIGNVSVELLSIAIAMKAEVNQNGEDFLRQALISGRHECALKLIDAGAQVKDEHLSMVTCWSYHHLYDPTSRRHLKKAGLYDKAVAQKMYACDIAEKLIEGGVNVNAVDDQNRTSLYYAVTQENVPLVQLLLRHGARTDCTTRSGYPLLHPSSIKNPIVIDLIAQAQVQQQAADRRERLQGCCTVS